MQEWYSEQKDEFPHMTRRKLMDGAEFAADRKRDWERRFNQRFFDSVPPGETEPRMWRNIAAIIQQRKRYIKVSEHFRVNADPKAFGRLCQVPRMPEQILKLRAERDRMESEDEAAVNALTPPADALRRAVRHRRSEASQVTRWIWILQTTSRPKGVLILMVMVIKKRLVLRALVAVSEYEIKVGVLSRSEVMGTMLASGSETPRTTTMMVLAVRVLAVRVPAMMLPPNAENVQACTAVAAFEEADQCQGG